MSITDELLGLLRMAAQKAVLAPIVEPGEDWDGERSERFARVAMLLNTIGWQTGEAGPEVVIDIDEHALALREVLVWALHDALVEQHQADHEHVYANGSSERMCSFAVLIDAASRERAREDVRLRHLGDQAEALVGELEVEAVSRSLGGRPTEQGAGCIARLCGRLTGLSFLPGVACRRERACQV